MFDWARGSMWLKLIEENVFRADWEKEHGDWLKTWSIPWFLGSIDLKAGISMLDVGSGVPYTAQRLVSTFGCSVDALDAAPQDNQGPSAFGLPDRVHDSYPDIRVHYGFAGDDVLPSDSYDVVYCNSVIEHTYDRHDVMDPSRPLAHINVLRDLVRMVRPGGLLLLNWDIYLTGVPHFLGWEFEADLWLLLHCGMRLADPRRRVRSARYIYDHPDTLTFSPEVVLPYAAPFLPKAVSVNAILMKPNGEQRVKLFPNARLDEHYFPGPETVANDGCCEMTGPSTGEIDARFRAYMARLEGALGGPIYQRD